MAYSLVAWGRSISLPVKGASSLSLAHNIALFDEPVKIQRPRRFGPVGQGGIDFIGDESLVIDVVENEPVIRLQRGVRRGLMPLKLFLDAP